MPHKICCLHLKDCHPLNLKNNLSDLEASSSSQSSLNTLAIVHRKLVILFTALGKARNANAMGECGMV